MRVKISEKQLFAGIVLFLAGIFVLYSTRLVSAPVSLSEKGILLDGVAIAFLVFAIRLIGRSIHKQKS